MVRIATEHNVPVTDVVLEERDATFGRSRGSTDLVMAEYEHNLKAVEIGADGVKVFYLDHCDPMNKTEGTKFFTDKFLDDALFYTLAAQVGNHCVGLRPAQEPVTTVPIRVSSRP